MATYYVDLGSPGAFNTRDGLSTSACWYGVAGMQHFMNVCAAGDTVNVKGTGNLANFYEVAYDANSGSLTTREAVTWDDGAGVVVYRSTQATPVRIEVTSGNPPSDNDVITGSTSGSTITVNGTPVKASIIIYTTGSNNLGPVSIVGCANDSSFTINGTRAVFTGSSAADGDHLFKNNGIGINLYMWRNIRFTASGGTSKSAHYVSTTSTYGWVHINCSCDNMSGTWGLGAFSRGLMFRCVSYNNTGSGFDTSGSYAYIACVSRDNGSHGFTFDTAETIIGCVSHNNTGTGYYSANSGGLVFNSISDGDANGTGQTSHSNTFQLYVIGCRLTNPGTAGIASTGEPNLVGYTYYESGGTPGTTFKEILDDSDTTTNLTSGTEGYTDLANHDFNLTSSASLRRTGITLPWS